MTGDWIVSELDATDDCPEALQDTPAANFPDHHKLRLVQVGGRLFRCGGNVVSSVGEAALSSDGFAFDTGDCCSLSDPDGNFGVSYTQRFTATLPDDDGVASVTQEWTFSDIGTPGGIPLCKRTSHAVMVRIIQRCDTDVECLHLGGCERCVTGICMTASACR